MTDKILASLLIDESGAATLTGKGVEQQLPMVDHDVDAPSATGVTPGVREQQSPAALSPLNGGCSHGRSAGSDRSTVSRFTRPSRRTRQPVERSSNSSAPGER
jgi:hypothetical protein